MLYLVNKISLNLPGSIWPCLADLVSPMSLFVFEQSISAWKETEKAKILSTTGWLTLEANLIMFNDIFKLIQKLQWIDQASCYLRDTTSALAVQNFTKVKELIGKATDRKEINQLLLPGWTLASPGSHCVFFIISYVLYSKNSTETLFSSLISYEGRQHGPVFTKTQFHVILEVSTVLGHQQSCILQTDFKEKAETGKGENCNKNN